MHIACTQTHTHTHQKRDFVFGFSVPCLVTRHSFLLSECRMLHLGFCREKKLWMNKIVSEILWKFVLMYFQLAALISFSKANFSIFIFIFQDFSTPTNECTLLHMQNFNFDALKCLVFHFRWCDSDFMILFTLDQCVNHKNDETQEDKRRQSLLSLLHRNQNKTGLQIHCIWLYTQ